MKISRLLITPWLHKNLAPANLPPLAECLDPGLEDSGAAYISPLLPLNAAQARDALREMLDLGAPRTKF